MYIPYSVEKSTEDWVSRQLKANIPACADFLLHNISISFFFVWFFSIIYNLLSYSFVSMFLFTFLSAVWDLLLLSADSRVINGSHAYQTNMDPMVAMGTASAAPQKGGGWGGVERARAGGGWGMLSEKQEGEGDEEQQWGGWWMEKEEMEKEGWSERGEERSPLLSVWNIWFSRKGDLGEEDKSRSAFSLILSLCFSYHSSPPPSPSFYKWY